MRKSTKAIAAGVLAAVVGTGVALADIEFSASNNNQISNPGTGNPIMNETGQDYLIEILWSAGDPSGSAPGIGGGAGAGEYLLTSATNGGYSGPNGAYSGYYGLAYGLFGTANYGDGSVGGADVNSGYVYSRIYENTPIGAGPWYLQPPMAGPSISESRPAGGTPPLPPDFDLDNGAGALDSQVIPEPGSVLLVAIGVGTILVRRFRRKDEV